MGSVDRIFRTALALLIIVLFFLNIITGLLATILILLSIIFLITSFVSFCPIYAVLGIKTCKVSEDLIKK